MDYWSCSGGQGGLIRAWTDEGAAAERRGTRVQFQYVTDTFVWEFGALDCEVDLWC